MPDALLVWGFTKVGHLPGVGDGEVAKLPQVQRAENHAQRMTVWTDDAGCVGLAASVSLTPRPRAGR